MLIPKITYLNKTTGTINGQDIMTISLRDDSQTNGDISTISWAFAVLIGPGTASLSNSTDKDVSLIIDNTQDITVVVTLTVTDSDGFTAQSRIAIIKSGANVSFLGHTIDSFVLPNSLTEFTISDDIQIINGTPVITSPAYGQYDFDKENNLVIDDTSAVPTTFSNTYTTNGVTARLSVQGGLAPFILFTEIAFDPVIENPKELVILKADDCTTLTVYSETEDYLPKLVGRGDLDNSSMTKLDVTLTRNCCTAEATILTLCPTYDLAITQTDPYVATGTYLADYLGTGIDYEIYEATMTLTGIDAAVISSITYTNRGDTTSTTVTSFTEPPQITVQVIIETTGLGGSLTGVELDQTNTIEITTTTGCIYTITYTLSLAGNIEGGGFTVMNLTLDSIDYPELPCGVTITNEPYNTTLTVNSAAFGYTNCDTDVEPLPDGVYTITLNDSGLSNETVTNCVFVDCETYCLVINALANDCPASIGILYDALTYQGNCYDYVSCQNLCDLYEMFLSQLELCDCSNYVNNVVRASSDCGCESKTNY
jgi:hypothetical protein